MGTHSLLLLDPHPSTHPLPCSHHPPTFRHLLFPRYSQYDISLREERELALERLRRVAHAGFISVLDFRNNPL